MITELDADQAMHKEQIKYTLELKQIGKKADDDEDEKPEEMKKDIKKEGTTQDKGGWMCCGPRAQGEESEDDDPNKATEESDSSLDVMVGEGEKKEDEEPPFAVECQSAEQEAYWKEFARIHGGESGSSDKNKKEEGGCMIF